ncbi:MAG: rhomboid family intramembrane serine protease [Candidatus Bathyarchaeia archaeon]
MFPLGDENPYNLTPIVTWGLLVVNILVFLWELITPLSLMRIVYTYGFIPALGFNIRLLTSMFLHADIVHLAGNMVYLWVFGDNVEDACGHLRFLLFYLLSGVSGSVALFFIEPTSPTPAIGASGAVSGLLGAYILLYPRARIRTLVLGFLSVRVIRLPAFILIGFWFLLQFYYGVSGVVSGVAYWAHIGGFIAGFLFIPIFATRRRRRSHWA